MHENSTRKTAERCAALSRVRFFATPQTVARRAPLSMGVLQASILEWVVTPFSRGSSQHRDRPRSPTLQADSLLSETSGKTRCRKRGIGLYSWWKWGFPGGNSDKEPACLCWRHKRHGFDPWVGKIPWKRAWQLTPVSLPGESHGQKSLVAYNS